MKLKLLLEVGYLPAHYARKEWVFLCEGCLVKLKPNNSITNMGEPGKHRQRCSFFSISMADGGSRYRFTEGCSLKIDAGQDSTIAPSGHF